MAMLSPSFWKAVGTLGMAAVLVGPVAEAQKAHSGAAKTVDWPTYGGPNGQRYSPLGQITTGNVGELKVAWSYDTGEKGGSGLQTSPIVVGDAMYACTPTQRILKLDAATGKLLWRFDSGEPVTQPSRGVAYWTDGKEGRVLAGVMNWLYALDPATGKPIPGFGENGRIDLRKGLRGEYEKISIALTTPGAIYKDMIIVGGRMPEAYPAAPGDIRAFDVRTGKLRWSFHTIPRPGEPGYETWPKDAWTYAGAANNWPGMTVDQARGIVYVPTGSAVMDFYGGDRLGNDLYADSLLALDANTGKLLWHFQEVHHDIWDRDLPSPPVLGTVMHDGRRVDVVAQTTKQGYVYVFDRVTGKPLWPIEEMKVAASTVPGEVASATQPRPTVPAPYTRQMVTAADLTERTPEAHAAALAHFKTMRSGGQFLPFAVDQDTLISPGFDGGAEWGGSSFDPVGQVLYVNANNISWYSSLTVPAAAGSAGEALYQTRCSMCHGLNRAGQPPAFPSLVGIHARLSDVEITDRIEHGKGRMPAFPDLSEAQVKEILRFLQTDVVKAPDAAKREMVSVASAGENDAGRRTPYQFTGYKKFLDPDGYPATAPPWGTLNAIDLKSGEYLWSRPLGVYPELAAKGTETTGTENYGGPVTTAGGVLFIAATTRDDKIRAFDMHTGEELWSAVLPFAGLATPTTYMVRGKQYVVIGAGGGKINPETQRGGVYVAYALP